MGFPESRNVAIEKYENEERSKEQETKKKKNVRYRGWWNFSVVQQEKVGALERMN